MAFDFKRYYYERGEESGIEKGIEKGISQGEENKTIELIRNLMKNMNLTCTEAMNALSIQKEKHEEYSRLVLQ